MPKAIWIVALLAFGCGVAPPRVPAFKAGQPALEQRKGALAILGDTQRTSWFERVVLCREDNSELQPKLIADLVAKDPAALVLVGDLVFDGGSNSDWEHFDQLFAKLPRTTPVLPMWGNHEYWRFSSERTTEQQLAARFLGLDGQRYYSRQLGHIGLVMLDSNLFISPRQRIKGLKPLPAPRLRRRGSNQTTDLEDFYDARWEEQKCFFESELERFEADPGVNQVFVFSHHPVYSLGPWGHPEPRLQELVKSFLSHGKARAWFSGHAHGYERFGLKDGERGAHGDKAFIVTAGGGGPRPAALELRPSPLAPARRGERPLNYVLASEQPGGVQLLVRGLLGDDRAGELERVVLSSPGN
ncbi:MAG: metallophosphoesterase [Polyangiaceae bacterium]|nr:metallophosphoesterase [Myxococcales bacterium]MCB9587436.1 metallophosphoesterase [Polyangiaceae bacterium]MCB9605767.1 metallophosphoesterase [Polyangiaceae bacterium]